MGVPTSNEAVVIAVATAVEDLRIGDVVGPADVAQPATFTVVGVPHRTYRQRVLLADVVLRIEDADSARTESFPQATLMYVRRWRALATITRADGTVDAVRRTIRLRPIGDTTTPVSMTALRLQPGESFTLSAT